MKYIVILFWAVAVPAIGQAQDEPQVIRPVMEDTSNAADEVLSYTEEMPQFPGGESAFQKYLSDSIRYPQAERDSMIQGIVYIYFEVWKDGSIRHVKTMRGIPGHPAMAKEAERVIREMPKWTPGRMNGRAVNVSQTVPVKFVIEK